MLEFITRILTQLHAAGFPEAVCAGGAIRDHLHGLEPKDIDIFIEDHEGLAQKLTDHFKGWQGKLVVPTHVAQYMAFENVHCVFEFVVPNFPPVQLIVMTKKIEPQAIIERHDFGICQVAHDGHRFYRTDAFVNDYTGHTFTLIRCRDEKDWNRSMKRWERLSKKYTGWRLVAERDPAWVTEPTKCSVGMAGPRCIYEVN